MRTVFSKMKRSTMCLIRKIFKPCPLVAVSNTSGLAGIAHWINTYFKLKDDKKVDKNSGLVVAMIKAWVDNE